MARTMTAVVQQFRRLSQFWQAGPDTDDAALLERFVQQHDQGAFAELVGRHGPLVLRVCRRLLATDADVEDAFQATFLIFLRKAGTITQKRSIAAWLYQVAQRVAWAARADTTRRQRWQRLVSDMNAIDVRPPAADRDDPAWLAQRRERDVLVEREVSRLPEKYRAPLVLCDLLGKTHADAAQELGLPAGSISRRLERGRGLLRQRLARHGITLGAAALASLLAGDAPAAVPAAWVDALAEAAAHAAAGTAIPAALLSSRAITLSQGVLRAMWWRSAQMIVAGVMALALFTGGAGLFAWTVLAAEPAPAAQAPPAPPAQKGPTPQQPAAKPADGAAMRLLFTAADKAEKNNGGMFVFVREGGLFFSAEADTVFVQRGGGFGMGGLLGGAGIGGGFGVGGPGMPGMNAPADALVAWSVAGKRKVKDYPGVQAAALSPGGKSIAMAGVFKNRRAARLVGVKSGQVSQEAEWKDHANPGLGGLAPIGPGSICFTPDGKRLILGAAFQTYAWQFKTNKIAPIIDGTSALEPVGVLPDNQSLLAINLTRGFGGVAGGPPGAAPQGGLGIWDIATGKHVRSFGDSMTRRAALSADGKSVATVSFAPGFGGNLGGIAGGFGGLGGVGLLGGAGVGAVPNPPPKDAPTARVQLWDVSTGKPAAECDTKVAPAMAQVRHNNGFLAIPGGVTDLAFSPDGRLLAAGVMTADIGHVVVFDVRSGGKVAAAKIAFGPQAVAFSRDGRLLAAAGSFGPFHLSVWDVSALTGAVPDTPIDQAALAGLWDDLGGDALPRVLRAERALAGGPPGLVLPLLRAKLRPVASTDAALQRLGRLVVDLNSDAFAVRDKASTDLARGGAAAALRYALKAGAGVEFRRRAELLLKRLDEEPLTPEQRRQQRAVALLATMKAPEARQLLDQIASGAPEAWLTQEAQAVRPAAVPKAAP